LRSLRFEIVIGVLKDAGKLPFLALITAGAIGWSQFRKLRVRPRGKS
jgi:hypothetical protein